MKHSLRTSLLLLYFTFSISVVAQQKTKPAKTKATTDAKTVTSAPITNSEGEISDGNQVENDSILYVGNPKDVKIFSFYSEYIAFHKKEIIDTLIHNLEFYNPAKQAQSFSQDLGVIGSANTPLILAFDPKVSFNIGIHSYDMFIRDLSKVELIETPTPITQLSYVMGSQKENNLQVQHSQSLSDNQIMAGIDFKLSNTVGYYTRQLSDIKNFNGNLAYRTKDNRYSIEGIYFHNKLVLQENGGIVTDSIYEQNIQENRQIISVNLAQAENLIKYSGVGIRQNFYLAKAEPDFSAIPDTNILNLDGYSVYHYKKPYFDPITSLGRLSHTFLYSTEIYQYSDSDGASAFYADTPSFNADTTFIFDSISHRRIENIISYSNAYYKDNIDNPKFLTYSFGLALVSNRYQQDSIVNTFSELNPQAKLQAFPTDNIYISASGMYSYRSDKSSAYNINGKIDLDFKKNKLELSVNSSSTQAGWIYQNFYSEYFKWNNSFENQKHQELIIQFTRKLMQIKAKAGLIHDYLYFDHNVTPLQYNEALSYFNVSVYKGVRFGNFGMDFNIIYQNVGADSILNVPKLYSNTQLFYTNTIFKGALDLQLGINIRYFSNYYAKAYMPALRSFYNQNDKLYGNYPYFDVFLNAKIKTARIFFKYEQLNSSFMPQNYFISPHYPNPDASIKFGVIWQLFN